MVPETYIKLIQNMYDDTKTVIRTPYGISEGFLINEGVHQGSALSPILFLTAINEVTTQLDSSPPWNMLYAGDITLLAENSEIRIKLKS